MKRFKLVFLLVILVTTSVFSDDDIKVFLETETPRIGVGEDFFVQIRVEGLNNVSGEFKLPENKFFRINQNGISQSQSVQYINGNISRKMSFAMNYRLTPIKKGRYKIGPAVFEYKGRKYKTKVLSVQVLSDPVARNNQTRRGGFFSFFNGPGWGRSDDESVTLELKQILLTNSYYANQEITLYLDILASRPVVSSVRFQSITRQGFWEEEALKRQRFQVEEQMINGERWYRYRKPVAYLYSIGTGIRSLPSYHVRVFYRDPLPTSKVLQVAPKKVVIKQIPEEGKPSGFSGDIGTFKLEIQEFPETAKVGEAFVVKVALTGKGNVQSINRLINIDNDNYQITESGNDTVLTRNFAGIAGRRTFSYLVTPLKKGLLKLPKWKLEYFNPAKKKYMNTTTSSNVVFVEEGPNKNNYQTNRSILTPLLKLDFDRSTIINSWLIFDNTTSLILIIFSVAGFAVVFAAKKIKNYRLENTQKIVKDNALASFTKKTKKALSLYKKSSSAAEIAGLLHKAAVQYVLEKNGLPGDNPGYERINKLMNEGEVDRADTQELLNILTELEMIRYGGYQSDLLVLTRKLSKLIKRINRLWVQK